MREHQASLLWSNLTFLVEIMMLWSRERSSLKWHNSSTGMFYRVFCYPSHLTWRVKHTLEVSGVFCGELPRMHFARFFGDVLHSASKDVRDRVLLPERNFRRLEMLSACRSATVQIRRPKAAKHAGIREALIAVINHIYCLTVTALTSPFSFSLYLFIFIFLFVFSRKPWGPAEVCLFSLKGRFTKKLSLFTRPHVVQTRMTFFLQWKTKVG